MRRLSALLFLLVALPVLSQDFSDDLSSPKHNKLLWAHTGFLEPAADATWYFCKPVPLVRGVGTLYSDGVDAVLYGDGLRAVGNGQTVPAVGNTWTAKALLVRLNGKDRIYTWQGNLQDPCVVHPTTVCYRALICGNAGGYTTWQTDEWWWWSTTCGHFTLPADMTLTQARALSTPYSVSQTAPYWKLNWDYPIMVYRTSSGADGGGAIAGRAMFFQWALGGISTLLPVPTSQSYLGGVAQTGGNRSVASTSTVANLSGMEALCGSCSVTAGEAGHAAGQHCPVIVMSMPY